MIRGSRTGVAILLAAVLGGCSRTMEFHVVDAQTHQPLKGVQIQRERTQTYGALRLEGETVRETLGPTNAAGQAVVMEVTGDDAVLFDMEGYWPAVVYADWPRDHIIESRSYDAEARDKTGFIGIDAVLAIKERVHKRLGIREGGRPVQRHGEAILVPLHPIGGND